MEKALRVSNEGLITIERVKPAIWVLSSAVLMFLALRGFILGFRLANWPDAALFMVVSFMLVYLRRELEHKVFQDKEKIMPVVVSLEYICLLTVLSGIIIIAQYGAVWGKPLVMHDSYLMKLDSLFFGFNWFKFNNLVMSHKILTEAINFVYSLITPSIVLLVVLLVKYKKEEEVARFFLFMLSTAAITVVVFHFYPVVGPVKNLSSSSLFSLIDHAYLPSIEAASVEKGSYLLGVQSLDGIKPVYSSGVYAMRGAICLPSYHAVLAFGYIYFSKNFSKVVRIAFITLSLLMCVAAIPAGNHFLVDILAGGLVALMGIEALPSRVDPILRLFSERC